MLGRVATAGRTGRRDSATDALLERELEVAALSELLEAARDGHGGLALVEGPPGMGKSTLLEHTARMAPERGLAVLRARAHRLELGFGWGVARSLFDMPLAELSAGERDELFAGPGEPAAAVLAGAEPVSGGGSAFAIAHALSWVAGRLAERGPLLLVVDDAHWADEPSLRFLVHLLGRLPEQPIALLVAARSGEPGEGDLLAHLAGEPEARVLSLEPLRAAAVASLVRYRLTDADDAFCERCFDLTGGNPLQLRVLLVAVGQQGGEADAALLEEAAELAARSLGHSVERRLGAVSADAQGLARALAVFEADAPLHLAAALAGLTPEAALGAADELERADVLEAGDPLRFTHPLLRAAVYGRMPFGERAQTHRQAAKLLSEAGRSGEQVSAHLLRSSPAGDAAVVAALRGSARRALAQGVPASAAAYLDRALREPPDPAEHAELLAELGRAEAVAGRPEAVEHLEAAIELTDDLCERAALHLELGRVLGAQGGRLAEAGEAFRRGLDELGTDGSELAKDLEGAWLTSAMHDPDLMPEVQRRIDTIMAGDQLESRAGRSLASKAMVMRLFAGEPHAETLELAKRLFGDGAMIGDRVDSQALTHVIGAMSWCDDYAAADEALALTFAEARRGGSVLTFAVASQLRSRQGLWTGPLDNAVADARAAVEIWRAGLRIFLHASSWCLISGLLEQGQPDEAEAVLELGEKHAATGYLSAWRLSSAGRVAAYRGEHAVALEAFQAAGHRLAELMIVNPAVLPWRSEAGLCARQLGDHELAESLVAEELELAERFGAPRAIGAARRAAGLLARGEAAVDLLRDASELLAGCGARVEHARALVDLGAAIRRAGRPREARETLREALALAQAAKAPALVERARAELRLAGGRAASPSESDGRLTPSERRVAELAAGGPSNREIASTLFITVKAVEWHLGNVYRKLGIRGRRELAGALEGEPAEPG
jgi:DNA-binding CsgD family transcriptional regulator